MLKVLVAGHDHHVRSLLNGLPGECTDDVVRLVATQRENRDAIRFQQLADALHPRVEVGLQLVGELLSRRLVVRIPLVAEAQSRIVHPPEVLGAVVGEKRLQEIDYSPGGRGVLATRGRQRARDQREECPVDQRVPVDQEDAGRRRRGDCGSGREGRIGHGAERQTAAARRELPHTNKLPRQPRRMDHARRSIRRRSRKQHRLP